MDFSPGSFEALRDQQRLLSLLHQQQQLQQQESEQIPEVQPNPCFFAGNPMIAGPSPRYPFTNEPLQQNFNQQQYSLTNGNQGTNLFQRFLSPARAGPTPSATFATTNPSNVHSMNRPLVDSLVGTRVPPSNEVVDETARLTVPLPPSSGPPSQDPSAQITDALLARELNSLSLEERERVFEEIHGVAVDEDGDVDVGRSSEEEDIDDDLTAVLLGNGGGGAKSRNSIKVEDPENVTRMIVEMHMEIQSNISHKEAYLQALSQNSVYVHDRDFLVRFLRADRYQPKQAAHRLVGFFAYKRELFGTDYLTKEITLDDLYENEEDRKTLEGGLYQVLPGRDRSGRVVVGKFHDPKFANLPLLSKLRVFYYVTMVSMEKEEDHKKGVVILVFNMYRENNRTETWKNCTLLWNLPVRVTAFHICHDGDPKVRILVSLGIMAMGPFSRMHLRVHEGTLMECIYKLLTFGISSRQLPIKESDGVNTDQMIVWVKQRQTIESSRDQQKPKSKKARRPKRSSPDSCSSEFAVMPGEFDVLLGRGKSSQNHPGNIRFRQLVESKRDEYERAKVLEKTLISERVVQTIRDLPGRFLRQDGDLWEEVDYETARDKVAHVFRDKRRKHKRLQQNGAESS